MAALDDAFQAAESLEPDDRLRLIAQLWASLPADHWAAPTEAELAEIERRLRDVDTDGLAIVPWKILRQMAANRSEPVVVASKIYSAPRRFDLATIFAVMSAYSLMFAFMSGFRAPPGLSLTVGGFITMVGIGQALLFGGRKPRAASIVAGVLTPLVAAIAFWIIQPRLYPAEYVLLVIFWCFVVGSALGYAAGVLVGGVFLIADALRKKFSRGISQEAEIVAADSAE